MLVSNHTTDFTQISVRYDASHSPAHLAAAPLCRNGYSIHRWSTEKRNTRKGCHPDTGEAAE